MANAIVAKLQAPIAKLREAINDPNSLNFPSQVQKANEVLTKCLGIKQQCQLVTRDATNALPDGVINAKDFKIDAIATQLRTLQGLYRVANRA